MKKIHTNSKIFFPDPYVVRVEYSDDTSFDDASKKYREIVRRAYKVIQGTWGYSALVYENVKVPEQRNNQALANVNGMNQQILHSIFDTDYLVIPRGYVCFREEADALQFRLSIDTTSRQVHMWPATAKFTIHEYIEDQPE